MLEGFAVALSLSNCLSLQSSPPALLSADQWSMLYIFSASSSTFTRFKNCPAKHAVFGGVFVAS